MGAILTTILVHAAIAVLLYFIVIAIPTEKPPEITAVTIPSTNQQKVTKKQLPRAVQKTPAAPANSRENDKSAANDM